MFKRTLKPLIAAAGIGAVTVASLSISTMAGAATCAAPAWTASYYKNTTLTGTPAVTRCDADLNFDWGTGSPAAGIPTDHFGAHWTTTRVMTAGTYRLSTTADDGIRLSMDGVVVVDDWKNQNVTTFNVSKSIAAGTHTFTVDYFDSTGSAIAKVSIVNQQDDSPTLTKLVADDEFTSSTLDTSRISVYNSSGSTKPLARVASQVSVGSGMLKLVTKGASGAGVCWCTASSTPSTPYRRYDFRARMSAGGGNGGVIMLWPNAATWPAGGEIDMAEISKPDRAAEDFVVHYSSENHQSLLTTGGDFTTWHNYSMEWTKTSIRYWVDGLLLYTITSATEIPRGAMHLVAQVGTHGTYDGTQPSSELDIDWVKVYR